MAVSFVANTHYFFSAGKDRLVKYWDGDRFEHIFTLAGHKGEVWAAATAPDGSFLVTGSHDRSIRVWRRTDEQVFLDEEREREFENVLESTLRDPDGEALVSGGGADTLGPLGADGLAVPAADTTAGGAGAAAVVTAPSGGSGDGINGGDVTTVVAHATKDASRGGDRLVEALTLAIEESAKWREYAQDVAAAVAAGDSPDVVEAPPRNLLLIGLTPAEYVLRAMRAVRPGDLDQVLLTLPFSEAMHLLRFLHFLLSAGRGVELCVRAALLLLRVHHSQSQIVANKSLLTLILSLKDAMHAAVQAQKRRVGFNVAALKFLDKSLSDEAGGGEEGSFSSSGGRANALAPLLGGGSAAAAAASKRGAASSGSGSSSSSAAAAGGVRVGKRRNVQLL